VCHHFGENHLELLEAYGAPAGSPACTLIGGCTFCDDAKVPFIDELDPTDNATQRLMQTAELREKGLIKPEVEWAGDGIVAVTMFLPAAEAVAEAAALELGRAMNLTDCEVIHKRVMHPAEGTLIELKGRLDVAIDPATLVIPEPPDVLTDEEIRDFVHERGLKCVAATVGNDEHSVGMREIIDIKHGGLEKWGFSVTYIEHAASVVLISTIITHADVHREMMGKLADLAEEKGVREKLLLISGGTQVTDEIARESGMDAGFGRRTKGIDVASFVVREMQTRGL